MKKSRAPGSTKQERMHIHKHTVDLTKKKENVLVPLPAWYTCWSGTCCTLCSSVCAGRRRFLKTSRRGNCWCSTWNIRTYQIILSSTKGATEGETCTMAAFITYIYLLNYYQAVNDLTNICPRILCLSWVLETSGAKEAFFSLLSLARTFNLWLWKAAEVSLSPDHLFTKEDKERYLVYVRTSWSHLLKYSYRAPNVPFLNCCFTHTEYLRKCGTLLHSLSGKKMSSISLLL